MAGGDDLLAGHLLAKEAWLGVAARFAGGLMGVGSGGAATAGKLTGLVAPAIFGGGKPGGVPPPPPGVNPAGTAPAGGALQKVSAFASGALAKAASGHDPLHRALGLSAYAAFALPYASERVHHNAALTKALNAYGLTALAANSARDLYHGDTPSLYDLGGVALFGGRMLHDELAARKRPPAP